MKRLEAICKAVINDGGASPSLKEYARELLVAPSPDTAEAIEQAAELAWINGISAAEYKSRLLAHAKAIS